jgi:hypothetical protein
VIAPALAGEAPEPPFVIETLLPPPAMLEAPPRRLSLLARVRSLRTFEALNSRSSRH